MKYLIATLILVGGCGDDNGVNSDAGRPTLPCAMSASDYCMKPVLMGYVPCSWSTLFNGRGCLEGARVDLTCGPYEAAIWNGIDIDTTAYYDRASGNIVAVTQYNANFGGHSSCLGGPMSGFVEPVCSGDQMNLCPDGGVD